MPFPSSNWLIALKLPTRIFVGLFIASLVVLFIDYKALIQLQQFHALARPSVIIGMVVFGCLSFASFGALAYEGISARQKVSLLSKRREIQQNEASAYRVQAEAEALRRLDYLSREEISYVADCLRKNEQSFLAYARSGPIANLIAKRLVGSPGSECNQDYYPFFFQDFAWKALLERKDEFIKKDDEFKRQDGQNRQRR